VPRQQPRASPPCRRLLKHSPVEARAHCCTRSRPDTYSDRNGCAQFAFRPRANRLFAHAATCVQRVGARSHASAPGVHSQSYPPTPCPTRPRPFPSVRARRICTLMNGRKYPHQRPCKESTLGPTHPRPASLVRAPSHEFAPNAFAP
jgi:hypothetical protein